MWHGRPWPSFRHNPLTRWPQNRIESDCAIVDHWNFFQNKPLLFIHLFRIDQCTLYIHFPSLFSLYNQTNWGNHIYDYTWSPPSLPSLRRYSINYWPSSLKSDINNHSSHLSKHAIKSIESLSYFPFILYLPFLPGRHPNHHPIATKHNVQISQYHNGELINLI